MNVEEYIASEYGTAEAKKPVELTEKQLEYNVRQAFITGQSNPSVETARKIWDAAKDFQYGKGAYEKNPHPDFDTFYKSLVRGQ